ncbi:hypothetical protein FDC27_08600 [Clostridium botulinum]|nr:hypothetical protein [Clostridium botulinum]
MKFTMFENGLDFILDSIRHLQKYEGIQSDDIKEKKELKYSLIHLSSGIELILKDRLYRVHWTYIFSDMNKANKKELKDYSFNSVDGVKVIDRLKNLCNVELNKNDENEIIKIRKLRNKIEHFEVKENELSKCKKCGELYWNYGLENDCEMCDLCRGN